MVFSWQRKEPRSAVRTLAAPDKPSKIDPRVTEVAWVGSAWRFRLWQRLVARGRYPWRGPDILSDEIVRWWLSKHPAEELISIPPAADAMLSALADAVMARAAKTPSDQLVPSEDLALMRAHFDRLRGWLREAREQEDAR
jgi:hypothetical protein